MKDGYILTKTGLEGFATMTSVPGRVRRRRRAGPRLPAGDHQRRHRLHGGAGRAALPRAGLNSSRRASRAVILAGFAARRGFPGDEAAAPGSRTA